MKIWETPLYAGSSYSDGEVVEERLLAILQHCQDISAMSAELRTHITDWPSEYHLSPVRHNLLRPFAIGPTDMVLELGCGCGALTRYLGETGAQIIAVEGSRRRASIAAERCRDLPNVNVYCDDLFHFHSTARFSHVTLIGVLEYARLFIPGPQSELRCLQSAVGWLSDSGQLLLAIENQFGLKYFNGCAEDHLSIPSFGIHDLYASNTPITFGHLDLQKLLLQAGLVAQEWMYPLPDYKLPSQLIHSNALSQPGFDIGDLLHDTCSRDYSGLQARTFHEGMVWRGLARNQLLPAMANSFLVSAQRVIPEPPQPTWLAVSFNLQRQPAFCTQTTFVTKSNGTLEVRKQRLVAGARPSVSAVAAGLQHTPAPHTPYVSGSLHAATFQQLASRAKTLEDLKPWLQQWLRFLRAEQTRVGLSDDDLPGHLLDAIPGNLVSDTKGQLQLIDVEWHMESPVSMNWVLIRGMVKTLGAAPPCTVFHNMTFEQAVTRLMALIGFTLKPADLKNYVEHEYVLQQACQSTPISVLELRNTLHTMVYSNSSLGLVERETQSLRDEIKRVKRSWSWRITIPLRLISKLIS